jgi:hypothetical protein
MSKKRERDEFDALLSKSFAQLQRFKLGDATQLCKREMTALVAANPERAAEILSMTKEPAEIALKKRAYSRIVAAVAVGEHFPREWVQEAVLQEKPGVSIRLSIATAENIKDHFARSTKNMERQISAHGTEQEALDKLLPIMATGKNFEEAVQQLELFDDQQSDAA